MAAVREYVANSADVLVIPDVTSPRKRHYSMAVPLRPDVQGQRLFRVTEMAEAIFDWA